MASFRITSSRQTWDGVWDAKTQIHADGWSVEYKIPFHILRFSPKDEYIWGLQVNRTISRKKEETHWRLIKKDDRMGFPFRGPDRHQKHRPSRHLELVPYAMGRATLNSGTDLWGTLAPISNMESPPELHLMPQSIPIWTGRSRSSDSKPLGIRGIF